MSLGAFLRYAASHPVARRTPVRTSMRIASWQLRSRLGQGPFVEPWIDDIRLSVSRGMLGATGNLYYGLHEFVDMAFVLHLLRAGDLFFDIGANIGSYTLLAAGHCGASCWSFEPAAETRPLLVENIRLNRMEDRVRVFDCALGAQDGEISFSAGEDAGNRVVAADYSGAVQTVAVRRLDGLIGDARPVMMKIDVEGHEAEVFSAAEETLGRDSLLAIEIETITPEVEALLSRHGFVRRWYDPFRRALVEQSPGLKANNQLYVRQVEKIAERLRSAGPVNVAGVML